MKFLDYEKIIRNNYPVLIDSYVRQYGEEYRKRIEEVLEKVKYCFYATPVTISEYILRRRNEDFFKAVIEFYNDNNIDISNIFIDEDEFVVNDDKVKRLTEIFFPWVLSSKKDNRVEGLYLFDERLDGLDFDNEITKDRIVLLKKFLKMDESLDDWDYYNSSKYREDCLFMRKILDNFLNYYDKYCSDDYSELWEYGKKLEEDIYKAGLKYEKEFMIEIKDYLCDEDLSLIESGQDFDVRDLKDYRIFFDECLEENKMTFSEGPLYYFSEKYDFLLLSDETDTKMKEEIVQMRLNFLRYQGYDVNLLEGMDLYCDWSEIDCLKDFIVDKNLLEEILEQKEIFVNKFNYEAAKMSVINDYDLLEADPEIDTIIDSNGHSCCICVRDDFDLNNFTSIVCLCPFDDIYNLFDIAIDHELRHAIETYLWEKENGYVIKIGSYIGDLSSDFLSSISLFSAYNEVVTEKLSVEACRERWERGQFIFSDKFALMTIYPLAVYDYCFENFDILYDGLEDVIIDAQISDDIDKVYALFGKEDLEIIDSSLEDFSSDVKDEFMVIRDKALKKRGLAPKVKKL